MASARPGSASASAAIANITEKTTPPLDVLLDWVKKNIRNEVPLAERRSIE